MKVRILLFAGAKQIAGADCLEVELPEGATIANLRAAMSTKCPAGEVIFRRSQFSVNSEYSGDDDVVDPRAEIACIPPVSGG